MLHSEVLALFGKQTQVKTFAALPPLESTVMDTVFKNRLQHPMAMIGIKDIIEITQTTPVISRSAPAVPVSDGSSSYSFIEPLALNPSDFISARELNDLKTWGIATREVWLQSKQEKLRRIVRRSSEGIATTALSGTVSWPLKLESGGWDTYQVSYGSVLSYTPDKKWDADGVLIADVYDTLMKMRREIRKKGYGGTIEIWAGDDVYMALMKIVDSVKSTIKQNIRLEKVEAGIDVGGYLVKPMDETYQNPQTGAAVDKVAAHKLCMIALDAGHALYYCALDDLDANLQPLPFFMKPIVKQNPSGIDVLGMSKPLPVINPNGICWAELAAE
ncbi:hypothetical protein DO021_19610 [Desulfobacter hydrogenophilus]|uniref:Major capsid protein E n=1 Tax=Desulfobacter hydrogenophilus TaxID=2291 RepID=A0A328F804_9BACT|nr:major capsid protein [Desulfobacter hydrogenophilus]NDY73979.1 hypothetical protein [Desulfobacter hydrogenophilus]QBH14324.1 hypothetical protein EYB58_16210 [Desulfobacter hydrogenophilus]RAM00326.1 hypothetical protein DO021_19610 [Desulfobacter hydrogenophilus]